MKKSLLKLIFLLLFIATFSTAKAINYTIVITNNATGSCTNEDSIRIQTMNGYEYVLAPVPAGTTTVNCVTFSSNATAVFWYINGSSFSVPMGFSGYCGGQAACVNEPCFNFGHTFSCSITTGGATFPCVGDLITITFN